jgi:rubrerythrin
MTDPQTDPPAAPAHDAETVVEGIGRAFVQRLLEVPEGRRLMLSISVDAEEGDESGVFDRLAEVVDEPALQRVVMTHRDDEVRHASLFRGCLARNGWDKLDVPDSMRVIREVADGDGADEPARPAIDTAEDIVATYALLLVIEERGVERFGHIAEAFRPHDPETAEVYLQVARDERGHTRYCHRIGRHYASNDQAWDDAVAEARAREEAAFGRVGIATLTYAEERGWVDTRSLLADHEVGSTA